jgi:hypothetical protein
VKPSSSCNTVLILGNVETAFSLDIHLTFWNPTDPYSTIFLWFLVLQTIRQPMLTSAAIRLSLIPQVSSFRIVSLWTLGIGKACCDTTLNHSSTGCSIYRLCFQSPRVPSKRSSNSWSTTSSSFVLAQVSTSPNNCWKICFL